MSKPLSLQKSDMPRAGPTLPAHAEVFGGLPEIITPQVINVLCGEAEPSDRVRSARVVPLPLG